MSVHKLFKIIVMVVVALVPCSLYAAPDQYRGDTSIYGGITTTIQPNILIILDNSGSMSGQVISSTTPYDPNTTYPVLKKCNGNNCSANTVYKASDYSSYIANVDSVTTSCGGADPRNLLKTTGQYSGRKLKSSGACDSGTSSYVLGNYVNWLKGPSTVYRSKIDIAKDVVTNLVQTTNGVSFGLMKFNGSNEGGSFISKSVSSSNYISTIKNMDDIHTGTTTNRAALVSIISDFTASTWTPLAETLFEAYRYYSGGTPKFGSVGFVAGANYVTPIKASCQKNYIILVTDGMSTQDKNAILGTEIGDFDGDGADPGTFDDSGSHYLDDVAKYLYDTDMLADDEAEPATVGTQRVTTFTIGFGISGDAVTLLSRTADSSHGHGQYFLASDQTGLTESLTKVISNILETNSSFVAPVVPVSPENKTSSASRMYIGLFKPSTVAFWEGNLKKFGLDSKNNLVDQNGAYANYVDINVKAGCSTKECEGYDDRNGDSIPNGKQNGSFRETSKSFWSTSIDTSDVNTGGVGELLQKSTISNRKIYTYFGNAALTDASNVFDTTNASLTAALLGVTDTTAKDDLINYVRGIDAYDENDNGSKTDNRDWVMGDVLHSKPTVVNYNRYTFTAANEANCSVNKTMIYVGANDGMLHAFKDCDGSEAWAFISPDVLPNLKYSAGDTHTSFIDSTVTSYVYDTPVANNVGDGTVNSVYLLVGQRRGGGSNAASKGYYYLLDATDPANPRYISSFSNATSGFSELGESWSEPKIEKIKVGTDYKMAAIFGSGYDNINEDGRYGATQTCTGTVSAADTGAGSVTSAAGTSTITKGRGIYILEIALLVSGANGYTSNFDNSGSLIWSYTNADNSAMAFSIAGEIATLDTKGRGYADRLYATDSAGNLWRFNIGAGTTTSTITSWTGLKVFTANPGSIGTTDIGRKAFYKPAVVLDYCYDPVTAKSVTCDMVFYGTGDREHPLNKNVLDRIYMIKVKDKDTVGKTESCANGETDTTKCLLDVTVDQLQTIEDTTGANVAANRTLTNVLIANFQNLLKNSGGWYIKLDENEGEKILSPPRIINKVAYITSYVPTNSDPCQVANPGDSYVYQLNYQTGEAVLNLDKTNDAPNKTTVLTVNTRGQAKESATVLARSDRKGLIGQGIASGVVVATTADGVTSVFLSSGGNIVPVPTTKGQSAKTLYWRQK